MFLEFVTDHPVKVSSSLLEWGGLKKKACWPLLNQLLILFKVFLVVGLFLLSPYSIDAFVFDDPLAYETSEQVLSDEDPVLVYLGSGSINLISENYQEAFDDYQNARAAYCGDDNGTEFFILFGLVIICDNLHLFDYRQNYLYQLTRLMDASKDIESFSEDSDYNVVNFLKKLACMAFSEEITHVLLGFVEDIFPAEGTCNSLCCWRSSGTFLDQTEFMIVPCSFWKRIKKLGRNLVRICAKIINMVEKISKLIDKLEGKLKIHDRDSWEDPKDCVFVIQACPSSFLAFQGSVVTG